METPKEYPEAEIGMKIPDFDSNNPQTEIYNSLYGTFRLSRQETYENLYTDQTEPVFRYDSVDQKGIFLPVTLDGEVIQPIFH